MEEVAHVPKFGNWEDKDVAYTNYFDNVRKDKVVGFNPNDPEENPEAFILKQTIQEHHPIKDDNKLSQKAIVYKSTRSYNDGYHSRSGAAQMQAVSASTPTERLCCFFKEPRE
ncbi:hypothetical protein HPP92_000208 [Vanilla planifolia]|uniref:RIN4 pathogenic type III effector avirulence factor Avr cleavage site domain-containing protein n=1 Tax=Vanilla planifolia TaxID=51239 RepID=A0A835VE69_VANPL|nr:hypothetical protein HPP92_000208 [Vanilla planifolia]